MTALSSSKAGPKTKTKKSWGRSNGSNFAFVKASTDADISDSYPKNRCRVNTAHYVALHNFAAADRPSVRSVAGTRLISAKILQQGRCLVLDKMHNGGVSSLVGSNRTGGAP